MNLRELKTCLASDLDSVELEILAIDPSIYLIRVTHLGQQQILQQAGGKRFGASANFRCTSLAQSKRLLANAGARQAYLVHDSVYSEMIGTESERSATRMRLPLTMVEADATG